MEIKVKNTHLVKAKELRIHCKVRDEFTASLHDENGSEIHSPEDGYVPGFIPGQHYGDYVILNVDLEMTRQIANWKTPKPEQLEQWIEGE